MCLNILASTDLRCNFCQRKFKLRIALFMHKLNKHKVLEKDMKISTIVTDSMEMEDVIHSSDSDCDYRISTKIEKVPKLIQFEDHIAQEVMVENLPSSNFATYENSFGSVDLSNVAVENLAEKSVEDFEKIVFECIYCKSIHKDEIKLRKHMSRWHYVDHVISSAKELKPFLCTYCGKYFERRDSFKIHTRSHTNERPYTCLICGKSFMMSKLLKDHTNTHSGVRLA